MSAPVQPSKTFNVVLAQHEKRESKNNGKKSKAPSFQFRLMSIREAMDLEDAFVDADDMTGSAREFVPRICNALRKVLVGWKNQKDFSTGSEIPFDAKRLEDVCDMADLLELRGRVVTEATVKSLDLKGLGSQSPSDADMSAVAAGQDIALAVEKTLNDERLGSSVRGVMEPVEDARGATTADG